MKLIPRNYFLDDVFEDFNSSNNSMKCDVYEKDGAYNIEVDVPGFKKEDINMELENGYLKVSAEKTLDSDEKENKKYVRRERHSFTKCERSFYVGDVSEEDIKAKFKNGILEISVPKEEKKKEDKKIIMIED